MRLLFVISIILYCSISKSNAQTLQWAGKLGGGGNGDQGNSIAVAASGNVYTTGYFISTGDFDPGAGVFNMTALGSTPTSTDIFISKLDASGNFIWANRIGGITDADQANAIVLDANENVYITGYFQGKADFNPGAGVYNLNSIGAEDIFVCKLDSAGNFIWAVQMGGSGSAGADLSNGNAIAIDASSNIYVTGFFSSTVDFDPGSGVFDLIAGERDIFILKLTSSGNFIWAKQMEGTGYSAGYSIKVDVQANVYTTGSYTQNTDFDPGPGVFNLTGKPWYNVFISKLDSAGNFIWAKRMGGETNANNENGRSIAIDNAGNVYITGYFRDIVDFDPGPAIYNLTSSGFTDMFISKLDSSGNFVWAKQIGGTSNNFSNSVFASSIALDANANINITGSFSNTTDFDPGPGIYLLTGSLGDIFIVRLDSSANFLYAGQMGSNFYTDIANSLVLDSTGCIYATGYFQATCDFDPGAGVYNLYTPNGAGGGAAFVVKLCDTTLITSLPIELLSFTGKAENDKNILYWTTASETNNDYFSLFKSSTGKDFQPIAKIDGAGNSSQTLNYSFIDQHLFTEINYYILQQTDYNGQNNFSKIIALKNSSDKISPLIISPNPATDEIIISGIDFNTSDEIQIVNTLGEIVYKSAMSATAEGQNVKIPLWDLGAGIYFIKVNHSPFGGQGKFYAQKFIKQ